MLKPLGVVFLAASGGIQFWRGPTGSWQYITFTYNGSSLRAYLNGNPLGAALTRSIPAVTDAAALGAWYDGSGFDDFLSGSLDDVRIYDIALSQAQIQADMNTPVGGALILAGDGDGGIDLEDVILALQVAAGQSVGVPLQAGADVNADGKIGIPEVVFGLQRVAGSRSQ